MDNMAETGKVTKLTRKAARKGKKAWRKNIDLSLIEQGLVSKLHDERTLDTSKASNSALFSIETAGDAQQRFKTKRLRVDDILASRSSVPSVQTRASAKLSTIKLNGKQRNVSKFQTSSLKTMIKTILTEVVPEPILVLPETPWHSLIPQKVNEYVTETLKLVVKKPTVPGLKAICKTAELHPGQSYNPGHEDHQALIQQAVNEQQAKIDALDKAKLKMAYPSALDLLDDSMLLSDGEQDEDNEEQKQVFVQAKAERKTKTQRNKLAKQKLEKKKAEKMLAFRNEQKKSDFNVDEVLKSEKKEKTIKRLGPNRFEKVDTVCALTEDLPSTIRDMVQYTNTFQGVFNNLQEKGMIEQRHKANRKRRYGLKSVEVHSYKRFE